MFRINYFHGKISFQPKKKFKKKILKKKKKFN